MGFVALLALLAIACDTTAPGASAATSTSSATSAATCPATDLAGFVVAFAESPALQMAYTAPVVDTAFVDWNAQPEPSESVEPMSREALRFPIMPNRVRQQAEGLRYREIGSEGDRTTVALEVPDTDSQLLYTFRRDACWTLVKVVDPAFGKAFAGRAPASELRGLLADGESLMLEKTGDFNNDGIDDRVLIIESARAPLASTTKESATRCLVLVVNTPNGDPKIVQTSSLIACSTCGDLLDDPFSQREISIQKGALTIRQTHGGFQPTTITYVVDYDISGGVWRVKSAQRERQIQEESGKLISRKESLTAGRIVPLVGFDGGWITPEYWSGVAVDEATGRYVTHFNASGRSSLRKALADGCPAKNGCKTLLESLYGCIVVYRASPNRFYVRSGDRAQIPSLDRQAKSACDAEHDTTCARIVDECSIAE